ncbi:MAG: DUF2442 domain-containing protein [Thiomicrospira sp.]|uniref:DUF2442 domain-containing protein n=1 Tax=Thiomicrospira sp. TaxID=935 RepID=UPI0019E05CE7|nr:DUF2442 domain-containing protein [Thiomicrospira sp.]MBE0494683.1 DUF2442 domain-containing protein [Thiomicrospira sp.]
MKTDAVDVKPLESTKLLVTFKDGKQGVLDMSPYLDFGAFSALKSRDYFNQVMIVFGAISWPDGQDIAPDTAYAETQVLELSSPVIQTQTSSNIGLVHSE